VHPVIATGTPYEQMGLIRTLWHRCFPTKLTTKLFDESLNSHLFSTGLSGSGKSRFITALGRAAIDQGHSVFAIDTASDINTQLLYHCIHKGIAPERVIILDATTPYPVPDFHVFDVPPHLHPDSIIDGLVAAHRGFLGESFGERQADVLRMLFWAMLKANIPLFPYSIAFLTYEQTRNAILQRAHDPTITRFWTHMTKLRGFGEIIESSRNKLNAVAMNRLCAQYFDSNTSTVNLYDAFNTGKIILLNLSENHYKDRSSRALLGSLFLFLAHQALLQREHDTKKPPITLLLDESHQYYVSDFVLPYFTGVRKHGAGIQLFSQSTNNFPDHDIDLFMSTAGHLISFGIGHKDAMRLAHDLVMPTLDSFVKDANTDLYGPYGDIKYWSVSEQINHIVSELMRQAERQLIWRIRTTHDIRVYLATTTYVEKLEVPPETEHAYRIASADHHTQSPLSPPQPTQDEDDDAPPTFRHRVS
jgi:hypothetical protein